MKKILYIVLVVSIAIFIAFCIDSVILGGDVINAIIARNSNTSFNLIEGGYYVLSHGVFTEVSYNSWILNFILECAAIITFPLVIICAVILQVKKDF